MKPQRRGIEMIFVHASVEARFSFCGNQRSRRSHPQIFQVRGDSVILVQGTQNYTYNNSHFVFFCSRPCC